MYINKMTHELSQFGPGMVSVATAYGGGAGGGCPWWRTHLRGVHPSTR